MLESTKQGIGVPRNLFMTTQSARDVRSAGFSALIQQSMKSKMNTSTPTLITVRVVESVQKNANQGPSPWWRRNDDEEERN